jgi:CheY-like chemotaxis protein
MLALAGEGDAQQLAEAAGSLEAQVNQAAVATRTDAVALGAPPTASTAALAFVAAPSVLVVDDTRVGRMLVENVLKAEGYRVLGAGSGEEALEVLEHQQPDLIVLDVRMPGMDGFELCERLRLMPHTQLTPVVFLSAACSLDERVRGLSVGGDDFIRKPFDGAELLARVKLHLARATLMAARR